ncbi:hypothetical protein, partial [Burkholderia pseudomallei]|uniref:hypothetical protein n=1 Tax=Burkholderia pseudomallei TaxID=28450 RepID=UPI001C825F5F
RVAARVSLRREGAYRRRARPVGAARRAQGRRASGRRVSRPVSLPKTLFFEHETIEELGEYLLERQGQERACHASNV